MQGATEAGGYCIGVLASDLMKTSLNRQNREGLSEGRLVLVSPFYPDAGFNAGNAMGRNRYIYALADRALVIDSALRSGGTWEGAMENLQARWAPLYVRSPGEGAGNEALLKAGGIAFSMAEDSPDALGDFFNQAAASEIVDRNGSQAEQSALGLADAEPATEPVVQAATLIETVLTAREPQAVDISRALPMLDDEAVGESANSRTSSLDMFNDFLTHLRPLLKAGSLTDDEVAASLGLEKSQAKAWLKRACEGGAVAKLKKPVRYSVSHQGKLC
jgi:predicted Rossmann fold nucleotide-binding protein DprA/Smf involved in DNA uptake